MATRYLIGKGELLATDIKPPKMKPDKVHPYTLYEAQRNVVPQIVATVEELRSLPAEACPNDVVVAKLDLHPAYIAKGFFPKNILRAAGLTSVGSRTIKLHPRRELRKTAPPICDTTRLLVAGTRSSFEAFPDLAMSLLEGTQEALQFAEIENVSSMTAADRIKSSPNKNDKIFEIGLHRVPWLTPVEQRAIFVAYAKKCGFTVNVDFEFLIGGMLFLAAEGDVKKIQMLGQFSLIRVIRAMPPLREFRPFTRGKALSLGFGLPRGQPLSNEPSVAILDGGLPDKHVLTPYVGRYSLSDVEAEDVPEFLDHGLGVTSAFLFGPLEASVEAARPYSYVDHHRVLDRKSDEEENPYELYRTLAHVEEILLSGRYQFLNLSLGPELPADDDDVHAWTAVLDTHLSDGETMMTVAVGNNGQRDSGTRLDRIQVPSDSVNALAIGAATSSSATWDRAPYSARGPGRSPGIRKPDAVMFGGHSKEYFHVAAAGAKPTLSATMGTSFAAPFALRTAVGVRAVLGDAVHPLTIKALMLHSAELSDTHNMIDVGWGRIPSDLNALITCEDGVARILYQGYLVPGKYIKAPIPLPDRALEGKVRVSATFCYASPVDVEDPASYTKAGLQIRFRPHSGKTKGENDNVATRSMFKAKVFQTEQELRSDLGKWENVLHGSEGMLGRSLKDPCFDIHYVARDGGGPANASAKKIRYALVVTIEAHRHEDLYDKILAAHAKLEAIRPKVALPVRLPS